MVLALAAIKCYNGVNYCRTTACGDSFVRVCPTMAMLNSSLRCPRFPSLQLYAQRDCENKRQLNGRNDARSFDEVFLRIRNLFCNFFIVFVYIITQIHFPLKMRNIFHFTHTILFISVFFYSLISHF